MAEEKDKIEKARPAHLWKPGQSGNPSGRPPGPTSKQRMLSRLTQIWMRMDAPDDWFTEGLKYLARGKGNNVQLNVAELIVARQAYCLAANVKFQNPQLLKEWNDRTEGKIPLRVLHRDADDATDDYEELSAEELKLYLQDLSRRAEQPALPENVESAPAEPKEPDGNPTESNT